MYRFSRRGFIGTSMHGAAAATAVGGVLAAPRAVRGQSAGDKVLLALIGGGGRVVEQQYGMFPDKWHIPNFIDCIRSRKPPHGEIERCHHSACLEHLANVAYRTGNQKLAFDGQTETFPDNAQANRYLKPTYRKHYRLPDEV